MRGFDFFISNIEDGILAALRSELDYVKDFATYGGELDSEQLRRALGELTSRLPLILVSYGDGQDVQDPRTAAVMDEPRIYRHDCTFTVICCSGDARGDLARRRNATGTYKMIADVR